MTPREASYKLSKATADLIEAARRGSWQDVLRARKDEADAATAYAQAHGFVRN